MKIINYIGRKIKLFTINMLEVFAFSRTYTWITICLNIIIGLGLFGNRLISLYSTLFIGLSYIVGWLYQIYKLNERIEELESQLNSMAKFDLEKSLFVKEDLADLMHEIWAKDINNISNPTKDELNRASSYYLNLSDEDKQVNKDKAEKVFDLFNHYYSFDDKYKV